MEEQIKKYEIVYDNGLNRVLVHKFKGTLSQVKDEVYRYAGKKHLPIKSATIMEVK